MAQQYVTEAAAIIQRREHLIEQLIRHPNESKSAEALAETFQAAASAMARHRKSIRDILRSPDKKVSDP